MGVAESNNGDAKRRYYPFSLSLSLFSYVTKSKSQFCFFTKTSGSHPFPTLTLLSLPNVWQKDVQNFQGCCNSTPIKSQISHFSFFITKTDVALTRTLIRYGYGDM